MSTNTGGFCARCGKPARFYVTTLSGLEPRCDDHGVLAVGATEEVVRLRAALQASEASQRALRETLEDCAVSTNMRSGWMGCSLCGAVSNHAGVPHKPACLLATAAPPVADAAAANRALREMLADVQDTYCELVHGDIRGHGGSCHSGHCPKIRELLAATPTAAQGMEG